MIRLPSAIAAEGFRNSVEKKKEKTVEFVGNFALKNRLLYATLIVGLLKLGKYSKIKRVSQMKRILAFMLVVMLILSCFAGCEKNPTPSTTPSTTPTTKPTETAPTEPVDPWAGYETITIAEALTLCEQFVESASTERYYIRGVITEMQNEQYGQLILTDETGSILVYGSYSADGALRYSEMSKKPVVGDEVLYYGTLQNYKGNTKEIQNGRIIDFISNGEEAPAPELPPFDSTLTIAELLALPLADAELTEGRYYVRATVESVTNPQYGQMIITDGKDSISVYGTYGADGSVGYANLEKKPVKGDEVLLYANVKNFKGTMELNSGWIIEFTSPEFDESAYTSMSIADARNTANGTLVKVEGVVAQITYANGMKPSGVILVDGTSSIYIYDGDLAGRVSVGNTITVAASKTMWILADEMASAEKFGYNGCNQLEKAWLLSNDEATTEFNKSWIQSTTVKDIMDTPVTEDITSVIFKVTAQIKEVPGNGFTNFYINDLDGKTGSYAYSQCNGSDFTWLREYDGKICTVYVMALNAKSSSTGCFWRFLPIAVVDEGFDVSSVNIPELGAKYYGATQFLTSYTGNPALELLTSVDAELLGVTGIKLSYSSSDPSVISVDNNVMNCHKSGTATITITAKYNGKTYSEKVTINVSIADQSGEYDSVKDAINAEVGTIVTVKGIVGPSLVNRDGFYLFNDDAMIAVIVNDAAIMETLEVGQEIVLEGMRDLFHNGEGNHAGQIALTGCTVVSNFYGNHEYSTSFFITDKTLADIVGLNISEQHSTEVYVVKATVEFVETAYYSTLNITSNGVTLKLYMSGAGQYSWLKAYTGQEVTLEIAPCNWNNKKDEWRGCVLAVVHADGSKTVNTLNFNN